VDRKAIGVMRQRNGELETKTRRREFARPVLRNGQRGHCRHSDIANLHAVEKAVNPNPLKDVDAFEFGIKYPSSIIGLHVLCTLLLPRKNSTFTLLLPRTTSTFTPLSPRKNSTSTPQRLW
jgi:hypothetical protein